ncbi:MAG: helix-turn-helix transcriptional regulator [Rubellimicrobium sp.]|nr:helix-turn-helix transcriptional regulator [Rubellimicrobium sp.]
MTSSLKRRSLSEPDRGARVHLYDLAAIRARNKNKAHSFLLDTFKESGLSKAEIAGMLGKKPEQITRWLAGPGNLTLDTLSDLIFVMSGQTFTLQARDELARGKSNQRHPDWLQMIEAPEYEQIPPQAGSGKAGVSSNQYVISASSQDGGTLWEL